MNANVQPIPALNLALAFIPVFLVWFVMLRWSLPSRQVIVANIRMLLQLLLVGYVLTYIFAAEHGLIIVVVLAVMLLAASGIAMRPISRRYRHLFWVIAAAIALGGVPTLFIVTQLVLDMNRWYQPSYMVPLAGMIFSNSMNSVSLAAERFESELQQQRPLLDCRRTALNAAMIPQINMLLAVGIVALPGMMTGQILSGVSPLIAAQYQIVVMGMVFGSSGISAATYLLLLRYVMPAQPGDAATV